MKKKLIAVLPHKCTELSRVIGDNIYVAHIQHFDDGSTRIMGCYWLRENGFCEHKRTFVEDTFEEEHKCHNLLGSV